jgi:hypothetical protein
LSRRDNPEPKIPLARQSHRDNDANAATSDSHPDCRSLSIQIAALHKDPPVPIAASERTKLLPLVSALLAETLAIIAETETSDEDHA